MSSWRAYGETIHHLALSLWLGAVVFSGVTAAIIFPRMEQLDPNLPGFDRFTGDHWRIAAGKVQQQVFLVSDIVQFGCAIIAVVSLVSMVLVLGLPRNRPAVLIRAGALGVALACSAGAIVIVAPQFNAALKLYWAAAAAGDMQAVGVHKAVVDRLHPVATRLLTSTAAAVLVALVSGLWSMARPWREATTGSLPGYPEPALARGRRA